MKYTTFVKFCALFIVVTILSVSGNVFVVSSQVVESVKALDIESLPLGNVTASDLGVSSASGTFIVSENGNKCLKVEYAGSEAKAYYEKRTVGDDVKVFATMVRFMIKDANTAGSVLAMTGLYGGKQKNYIRIENQDLYISDTPNSGGTKIYDDIELNQWYSVVEVLNSSNITREFWICDQNKLDSSTLNKYSISSSEGPEKDYARRWAVHVHSGAIYIDKVSTYEIKSAEWAAERIKLRAESIRDSTVLIGYEDGQYPKGAADMLIDAMETSNDSATLSGYLSAFKTDKKIDSNSASMDAAFVQVLTEETQNVAAGDKSTILLSAVAKTLSNQTISDAITWEIVDSSVSGFSISRNSLEIPALNSDATVKLKATYGELYAYSTLRIRTLKSADVTLNSFTARDGSIIVSGTLSEEINSAGLLTANGATINSSVPLNFGENNSFTGTIVLDNNTSWQDVTLSITGEEINTFEHEVVYYGAGWEDGVTQAFNDAVNAAETTELLEKYSLGLQVDEDLFTQHSDILGSRITFSQPFTSFNELSEQVKDIQFVLGFNDIVDENYETFIENHRLFMQAFGFDWEIYDSLDISHLELFYDRISEIIINVETDTATGLCSSLNEIVEEVKDYIINITVEPVKTLDFESLPLGEVKADSLSISAATGASIVLEGGLKSLKLEFTGSDARAYYEKRTFVESITNPVFVTSVRFMIKDANTSGTVLGMTGLYGTYQKNYIRIENQDLYISDEPTSGGTKFYEGIELNKWYSVFEVLDSSKMTREFWICDQDGLQADNKFKIQSSAPSKEYEYARRWVTQVKSGAIYLNKVSTYEIESTNWSTDKIRLRAESIRDTDVLIGYENEKYPKSAAEMLVDALKGTSDAATMNQYMTTFYSRKIDTSSTSEETAFIQILTKETISVSPNATTVVPLEAVAKTVGLVTTDDPVTWELLETDMPGLGLTGNSLTIVSEKADGNALLKVSAGSHYGYLSLQIHVLRNATIDSFIAQDGNIKVTGKISKMVNLGGALNAIGTTINKSVPLIIDENSNFTCSIVLEDDTPWQDVTLTIIGEEIDTYQQNVVYYGVDWENGVMAELNNAANSADAVMLLDKYNLMLKVDKDLLSRHGGVFGQRIKDGQPYNHFTELSENITDIQFVFGLYETVREDVEHFIQNNLQFMTYKGFNKDDLSSLDASKQYLFYARIPGIEVNLETNTPEELCSTLNGILADVINNSQNNIVTTPVIPGGSYGGSSSGSGLNGYQVNLVDDESGFDKKDDVNLQDLPQFADVEESHWAAKALLYMRQKGIIEGDGTSVRPSDGVTRGEFVKILVKAFSLSAGEDRFVFTDGEGKWWAEYASVAASMGIVNGTGNGCFDGELHITRQMLAVMVDRLIIAKNIELYNQSKSVKFTDLNLIEDYAVEAVNRLSQKGVISGVGNNLFAPGLKVTRAEAAQIIYNVLTQQ